MKKLTCTIALVLPIAFVTACGNESENGENALANIENNLQATAESDLQTENYTYSEEEPVPEQPPEPDMQGQKPLRSMDLLLLRSQIVGLYLA